jgi:hypothetical protein
VLETRGSTMWRPNEPVEDVSIRRANVADHAAALGVMGLLTKPSLAISKTFAPTERSSAPSSAMLILDP